MTALLDRKTWETDVTFLTNFTLDSVAGHTGMTLLADSRLPHGLKDHPDYPLTDEEAAFTWENDAAVPAVTTPHDLYGGSTVLYGGRKYHAPAVEFHFRNDATRPMWGSPIDLETHMPLPEVVEPLFDRCVENAARKLDGVRDAVVSPQKTGYMTTEDRYAVWVLVPFDYVLKTFKDVKQYKAFLTDLFA
jgi:hypothetical protein